MGSIYKPTYTKKDPVTGERVIRQTAKWYIEYLDENGFRKKEPGYKDKTATEQLLRDKEREVEFAKIGIRNPFKRHQETPLGEHLDAYQRELENRKASPSYVKTTISRVRAILEGRGMVFIGDLAPSDVNEFLGNLLRRGESIQTRNHYLRAIKMFTRWLVMDRRTGDDPIRHLSMLDAETDRRRERRPLSSEEFEKLLASARSGPPLDGITGPDRAMLYLVASYTGYRRNEIGSVTKQSFDFIADPPVLRIKPTISKRRKKDEIPLRRDVAELIRQWIDGEKQNVGPMEPLFPITDKNTAEMIKADLERAGIPYIDDNGLVADFHALRGTFATNLALANVPVKVMQELVRHSDVNLTMNIYAKIHKQHQKGAVEQLPPVPQPKPEQCLSDEGQDGDALEPPRSLPSHVPIPPRPKSIRELRREASQLGIKGYCKLKTAELIQSIARAQEERTGKDRLVGQLVERVVTDHQQTSSNGTDGVGQFDDSEVVVTRPNPLPNSMIGIQRRASSSLVSDQMGMEGVEPTPLARLDPKSSASANSATSPCG